MMTDKQLKAVKAIAEGATNKEASEASGLGEKYISHLKESSEFSHALAIACVDRLKGILPDSVSKLAEIIRSDDKKLYPTQVQAIKLVFEYGRLEDLQEKLPQEVNVNIKYE